jgi:glycosyltransferase involved in cell wall biosynthesis
MLGFEPLMNARISVIITTKNEERNIENCLKSIARQTWKETEIIVVDNGSTDRTCELARAFTPHVFTKGPERSVQRNFGMIEKASGTYVMYVDADMILAPSLLEAGILELQASGAAALHVPELVLGKTFWSRVRRFERLFYDNTAIDGARLFRRNAFIEARGFDETMSGPEDWDLDKKIKKIGKIAYLKRSTQPFDPELNMFVRERGVRPEKHGAVIYHNESEFDLYRYLRKKLYYSGSFDTYIKKWGPEDPDIKKQLGLTYRFFGVFLERGKWRKLLAHPVLTTGMYLLRFMVGCTFLWKKLVPGATKNPY